MIIGSFHPTWPPCISIHLDIESRWIDQSIDASMISIDSIDRFDRYQSSRSIDSIDRSTSFRSTSFGSVPVDGHLENHQKKKEEKKREKKRKKKERKKG